MNNNTCQYRLLEIINLTLSCKPTLTKKNTEKATVQREQKLFTIVVGKDAAHTPSRFKVLSSTPDATT